MSILGTNMLVCHGQEHGHQEVYSDLSEIASLPTYIYQNWDKVFICIKNVSRTIMTRIHAKPMISDYATFSFFDRAWYSTLGFTTKMS
jgi:hypothetical protein